MKCKISLKTTFFNYVFVSLTVLISIYGCGNKIETQNSPNNKNQKDSTLKQVIYTCPMHEEVRSVNKDDKCPKCGMNLEEMKDGSMNDTAQVKMHSDKYSVKLTTDPSSTKAGQDVTLNFTVTNNETKEVIKDLEVIHEKILHLIIVSKNLAYFDHIHPEMNSDGSLSVKTNFKYGGDYVLFADLTPKGEKKNQVFDLPLKVEGESVPQQTLTPRNTFEIEGYTATFTTNPTKLVTNKSIEIIVNLKKTVKQVIYTCPMHPEVKSTKKNDKCPKCGMNLEEMKQGSGNVKDVTNLQNYLGALGHMVIISEDASMYLHVHPMEAEDKEHSNEHNSMNNKKMESDKVTKSGPNVMFHTIFPKPGIYKVFAQFNPGGKLITTNFVVKVN